MADCPLNRDGVHRLNGMRCPCGYVLVVPPVCASLEITEHSRVVVSDGFNCESVKTAVARLQALLEKADA